jgi:hypothetical protein
VTAKRNKQWIAKIKIDFTHPPGLLFREKACIIAFVLAPKKVSPKVSGSGCGFLDTSSHRGEVGSPLRCARSWLGGIVATRKIAWKRNSMANEEMTLVVDQQRSCKYCKTRLKRGKKYSNLSEKTTRQHFVLNLLSNRARASQPIGLIGIIRSFHCGDGNAFV